MRHVTRVTRAARDARRQVRQPPQRVWAMRLRKAALLVVGFGLLGYAARTVWDAPATVRLTQSLRSSLIEATGEAGFVITRVYS